MMEYSYGLLSISGEPSMYYHIKLLMIFKIPYYIVAALLGYFNLYGVSSHVFCPSKHACGYSINC